MEKINIIEEIGRIVKENMVEDILEHIETVLISVDEFYDNIFFEVYKLHYLSKEKLSQTDIALELDITQSCVSKMLTKINDYIIKVAHMFIVNL